MKQTLLILASLLIFLLLPVQPLFAMGSPEDQSEDIFQLEPTTVTSVNPMEAGETVHEINAEDIKKTGARTLDEALVLLSDVNIKMGAEGVPRVEIRGFKTRNILVLMDGVPMNSALDGQFDPSIIPVDSISKIKVIAGASSVLYGQGALGGVIDIISKKGKRGLKGTLSYETGEGTPYLTKSSLSGAKGKYDFFLSGSMYRRDYFPVAKPFIGTLEESAGYRINSDNTRNNAYMNLGFTPNDTLHLAVSGNYVQGGYGKPASAINNKFDPYAPPARFGRVDNYEGYMFQFVANYNPTESLDIRSRIYYNQMTQDNNQYDDETYSTFDNPVMPNSYHLKNTGINTGASIQPAYDFGKAGSITFDFSGEQDQWIATGGVKPGGGESGASGGHGVGSGSPPYILYPVSDNYVVHLYSAAVEYKVTFLKKLGFAVGYGRHWQLREDKRLDDYSYSTSIYYDIFKATKLKAAFMRNIHFPSISQLYLRNTNNTRLLTEKANHYQFGVEQKLPWRSSFKINGFHSDIFNFIAMKQNITPQQGFAPYNFNFSQYRFYGFETSLETNFIKELQLKVQYTLNQSRDYSLPDRIEVQYVPKYKFVFTGKYEFAFGLIPFVSLVYVADSYVYSKQQYITVMRAKMADYAVINCRLSQKLFKNRFTIYVGADNIMNNNYEDTYGIPRPGRYVYGGIEYRFDL
ncbi:MAG: TonB-dependent receptor plug domain-containing protein [Proteobacteria bacterium]|nr:TonB-dependent receptor plug domain-containing protein [Pseudomonadota bacterium]